MAHGLSASALEPSPVLVKGDGDKVARDRLPGFLNQVNNKTPIPQFRVHYFISFNYK